MTSDVLCRLASVTYRQLDHWCRCGWVGQGMPGSGAHREWTRSQARHVRVMAVIVKAGVPPRRASKLADEALSRGLRVPMLALGTGLVLAVNLEDIGVWEPAAERALVVV